jgi:hypothetical protein
MSLSTRTIGGRAERIHIAAVEPHRGFLAAHTEATEAVIRQSNPGLTIEHAKRVLLCTGAGIEAALNVEVGLHAATKIFDPLQAVAAGGQTVATQHR